MTTYIVLLLIVFLLGFKLGEAFILKGLALRVKQLQEDGDERKASLIEEV